MIVSQMTDILGIGFGPTNIAFAVAMEKSWPDAQVNFLEAQERPSWQAEMLLDGAASSVALLLPPSKVSSKFCLQTHHKKRPLAYAFDSYCYHENEQRIEKRMKSMQANVHVIQSWPPGPCAWHDPASEDSHGICDDCMRQFFGIDPASLHLEIADEAPVPAVSRKRERRHGRDARAALVSPVANVSHPIECAKIRGARTRTVRPTSHWNVFKKWSGNDIPRAKHSD